MDSRFPKYLRWLASRVEFFAIPNLGGVVAGVAALAFMAKMFFGTPYERFVFDPILFQNGEWWRIFSFPVMAGDNPLYFIFYVLAIYFLFNALEEAWGAASLTLFVFFGYLAGIGGAFLIEHPVPIWFYILENVGLAFGTLFPEYQIYIYFILPVKAKWLALLSAGWILFQFVTSGVHGKLFLAIVHSPYVIFFGPFLWRRIKDWRANRRHKNRFDKDIWR